MNTIILFFTYLIIVVLWMAWGYYSAPHMDDKGKILIPGKTLKDLFKKIK